MDQLNADSYVQKLQELIEKQGIVNNSNGSNTNGNSGASQVEGVARKIALLEMKELNEREKAAYAEGMMKKVKEQNEEADKRLHELSSKFDDVSVCLFTHLFLFVYLQDSYSLVSVYQSLKCLY